MKISTIIVLAMLVVAVIGMVVFSLVILPGMRQSDLRKGSDAAQLKGTVKVCGDDYIGYTPIRMPVTTRILRNQHGYNLDWIDVPGYAERHEMFAKGECHIMLLPIDTYRLHGKRHNYPGVIASINSMSDGADMIVGYRDKLVLDGSREPTVNDLDNPNLRFCFTPESPSSFMMDVVMKDFPLDNLMAKRKQGGQWFIETNGSEEALKLLREKKCDVAILWEPNVSESFDITGVVPIFGSDRMKGKIVDVFVVYKKTMNENGDLVSAFFMSYYEGLSHYLANKNEMAKEIQRLSKFKSREAAEKAMDRVEWATLGDNCFTWFNADVSGQRSGQDRIYPTVTDITSVMQDTGTFTYDHIKDNPANIINGQLVNYLCGHYAHSNLIDITPSAIDFVPLSTEEWGKLGVSGLLRVPPIHFQGTQVVFESVPDLNTIGDKLKYNYPESRVLIKGHTFNGGDESGALALSQNRADFVRDYWSRQYQFDPDRVRSVGVGMKEPLPCAPAERPRECSAKQARVEVILLEKDP